MKKEELEKNLDNILIEGLIADGKRQDAELLEALERMSEDDFLDILASRIHYVEHVASFTHFSDSMVPPSLSIQSDESDIFEERKVPSVPMQSRTGRIMCFDEEKKPSWFRRHRILVLVAIAIVVIAAVILLLAL